MDLEKFSPLHFWGLVGFSGVCQRFSRRLSGYSTAPTAGEEEHGATAVTYWEDLCTRLWHLSWGVRCECFYFAMISTNMKDLNYFHNCCLRGEWIYKEECGFSSPDLFPTLQGGDEIFFISIHLEEVNQLYWVPIDTRRWAWSFAKVSHFILCCMVVLLPSVSNEETEAQLRARYSRFCPEACWFRVGSPELLFLNPSTCYATYCLILARLLCL